TGKNRTGHESAVIQLRFGCLGVIQYYQPNKFGVVSRQKSRERNDILSFFVTSVGIYFLRRPGFSRNDEAGNRRRRRCPAVPPHPTQRVTKLFRRLLGDHLPTTRR